MQFSRPLSFHDDSSEQASRYRNIAVGIGFSVLLHLVLLLILKSTKIAVDPATPLVTKNPLAVRLIQPSPQRQASKLIEPRLNHQSTSVYPKQKAISTAKPSQPLRTESSASVLPENSHSDSKVPPPAADFMAMINAKRRAAEENALRENTEARIQNRELSADEVSAANINRNLRSMTEERNNTNGIFQILHKGTRTAQFSFRGWTSNRDSGWREIIDVDAGLNGNIELAIVRKMIERIRKDYQGNFNWESHRLGRVIVLSARAGDDAALEKFLIREFFDAP